MNIYRISDASGLRLVFVTEYGAREAAKIEYREDHGPVHIEKVHVGRLSAGLFCKVINHCGDQYEESAETIDYYAGRFSARN